KFAMVAPDVQIDDGKGTILISSEEGETEVFLFKVLFTWSVRIPFKSRIFLFLPGCLKAYVFFCSEDLEKEVEFEVVGDNPEKVGPKPSEPTSRNITNGSDDGAQPSTSTG
ncbi:SAE2 enzyme, partial [Amazona guildingii]|nr:SAE2 enzyme [Amazona guildingii]